MNIVLVYNPHSGSAPDTEELRAVCRGRDIEIRAAIAVNDRFKEELKPYIKKDQVIAVVGGDGTISSVAALLVGTEAILAPLPGGTLNHFTKDLGIPQDLSEALARLPNIQPRAIDTASVNGTVFLNNSSIGLYPSSLQTREALKTQRIAKWLAKIIGSVRAFAKYRTYTVTIGDETFKTPFLFVGNNDYHLTDPTTGRQSLTEGVLSVCTIATASRWHLLATVAQAIVGLARSDDALKVWETTRLTIHTKRPRIRVSRDGELENLASPLTYEMTPQSLRVLC